MSLIQKIRHRAAVKRSRLFLNLLEHVPVQGRPMRVIDLGGSYQMWRRWQLANADFLRVTLANSHAHDTSHRDELRADNNPRFVELEADARKVGPTFLKAFDVVFSNSMLEHLPTRGDQEAVALAIRASGRPYFVQVPNKRCIVDPHTPSALAPFHGMWPLKLRAWALTKHALGTGCKSTRAAAFERELTYNPLGVADMRRLFPDAEIRVEWSIGLPMSIVAMRRPAPAPSVLMAEVA